MASLVGPNGMPPMGSFPGPLGSKRRRMRSGGNVSTLSNNNTHFNNPPPVPPSILDPAAEDMDDDSMNEGKSAKCKGTTTIPIFLKKTYKMIDTCDASIASWTEDGDMFVVKDPDTFATQVIPQYFDHNKFSSFARQLNFYGFRKMQSKPIRNSDFDAQTAKHVTFFNENFKRGRCDLLKNIQRSTRGGGATNPQDQQREVQNLKDQVSNLEQRLEEMSSEVEERMRRLELDMLARMEQMMLAMQQQQHTQLQLQSATSVGSAHPNNNNVNVNGRLTSVASVASTAAVNGQAHWDNNSFTVPRGNSINSMMSAFQQQHQHQQHQQHHPPPIPQPQQQPETHGNSGPTLPPHPKQKQLPMNGVLPPTFPGGPNRLNSLRGISTLSRGLSGLSRGASIESSASAVLMRNSWEDKFFSMLMLGESEQAAAAAADGTLLGPTPIAPGATPSNGMQNLHHQQQQQQQLQQQQAPITISTNSMDVRAGLQQPQPHSQGSENDDLSDVSDPGLR